MSTRDRIRSIFSNSSDERLFAVPSNDMLLFEPRTKAPDDEHWEITSPLAIYALNELAASGLVTEEGDSFKIQWEVLYEVLSDPDRESTLYSLGVPPVGDLRPRLRSANSLDDLDFEIAIDGWLENYQRVDLSKLGAVARTNEGLQLLPRASYELTKGVAEFWRQETRNAETNRQHWGHIRTLALRANAGLDLFLADTIVLTPEKLQVKLQDVHVAGLSVIEVQPWFAGAPDDWLVHFDRASKVRDLYQIATDQGLVEVLVTPQVKSVLMAIKAMPGRRASGAAAEKFIHNPFATLGQDATQVLDESQFDKARHEAGIEFEKFSARVKMIGDDLQEVGIVIERLMGNSSESVYKRFDTPSSLRGFITKVESKLLTGFELCEWHRHRLELTGDSSDQIELLKTAYDEWVKPKVSIKAVDVLDLKHYSERVSGIGVQSRIVSPYIPVESGPDPWFPEPPIKTESSVMVTVPIDEEREFEIVVDAKVFETLKAAAAKARAEGSPTVAVPGHLNLLPLDVADEIVAQLRPRFVQVDPKKNDTSAPDQPAPPKSAKQRKELLLWANISQPEFAEQRASELKLNPNTEPRLPSSLLQDFPLKEHQRTGLAWLQNLFDKAPNQCRGAVLADGMGLGKTVQLLAMICRAIEENPKLDPVLIVAPVSLLENWKEETDKFFGKKSPRILTLYGAALARLRAPRQVIEQELIDQGIARFLTPNWIGDAQVVLTTYETMRDLEFSLAAVHWSVLICDEAQKIKNPAAMVTRAAKKLNVGFRIACTGTPVENSLADLWCLFDFVQPGLLGALNHFGATYRRPIECETEEQQARLAELRALIDPQILRRIKRDVAKDLPPKTVDEKARELKISDYQRVLYGNALEQFRLKADSSGARPFKNHLGLLQYLRRICIAPESEPNSRFRSSTHEPLASYREKNPKIDWLIRTLRLIEPKGEKIIVFCEFRDTQLLLAHYIEQEFRFRPDIINGDTEATASASDSRQKRIKRFSTLSGFGVIILSPLAVGFGVNIQAANHVIHFSRSWNPAKEDQATDRAYRIGQTREVHVYYPVVCADDFTTFDVKLDRLLERKRSLSDDMLNGCGDLTPVDFAEIVEIDDRVFDERVTTGNVDVLDPLEFEALIAVLWKKEGFRSVELTPRTGDAGVDVVAKTVNVGELIQCKSSQADGAHLGWDAIKEVVAGEAKYKFENPGVKFSKVAVTNQFFNDNARLHAELNQVRLVDQTTLVQMLEKHRVVKGDIDSLLTSRVHVHIDLR